MRLMQVGEFFIIHNNQNVLRINGQLYFTCITDIVRAYSDSSISRSEEETCTTMLFGQCLCEFTTKESLKEQMVEYLI